MNADLTARLTDAFDFLLKGGPAIWAIAALSVITLALILFKIWRLSLLGAWSKNKTERAVTHWEAGDVKGAKAVIEGRRSIRAVVARTAFEVCSSDEFSDAEAREEIARVAKNALAQTRSGLRGLDLITTIAPLLGLLGTVLGMIEAFQALQEAGSRADPAALAGGIWEALLTTAAGMAVAIPAGIALTWFESVTASAQLDMEDNITRVLTRRLKASRATLQAAE